MCLDIVCLCIHFYHSRMLTNSSNRPSTTSYHTLSKPWRSITRMTSLCVELSFLLFASIPSTLRSVFPRPHFTCLSFSLHREFGTVQMLGLGTRALCFLLGQQRGCWDLLFASSPSCAPESELLPGPLSARRRLCATHLSGKWYC